MVVLHEATQKETGTPPKQADGMRARLTELGLSPYQCPLPALMDALSAHMACKKDLLH